MKTKSTVYRLQWTVLIAFLAVILLYPITNHLKTTFAQNSACSGTSPYRADGLVTTTNLSGKFNTSAGACIIDPDKEVFFDFIPSFDDLKKQFYNKAQSSNTVTKHDEVTSPAALPGGKIDLGSDKNHLYSFSDNVTITSNNIFPGNRSAVIFISKDLNIAPLSGNKLSTSQNTTGLVFVVGGNVAIDPTITQIDAVIISAGTIYTGGSGCNSSSVSTTDLTINGSLLSLNSAKSIKFCRTLQNNNSPAELIKWQSKYLAVLNDLFAVPFQKWSEIDAYIPLPPTSPPPSPPPSSPPPETTITYYRDADGDSYGNPTVTTTSSTGAPAGYVSNNTDCYDNSANAKPGQASYFATNRGDGSFDYNCDSTISKESVGYAGSGYYNSSTCTTATYRFLGGSPTCGEISTFCLTQGADSIVLYQLVGHIDPDTGEPYNSCDASFNTSWCSSITSAERCR